MSDTAGEGSEATVYRVLARKYRPASFADLIGQEALVRTLTNAIQSERLAHAFVLTGVRGTGKTTSARIIARALNCIGPDGTGGPTAEPCGQCKNCLAISQDRHVDVIEMDAASRTGVSDIRELIDGVRYRPVEARYKVYIIDEVHMLSNNAFNALLKTLEEPPEHVIFIFATTEIRKVPVTVLSRCQRFDLRRVDQAVLAAHFARILEQESLKAVPEALAMIARAADGSVRDGLSLLDQAIALSHGEEISADQVAGMLGLADRTRIFDLFDAVMRGAVPEALALLEDLYNAGADPIVLLQDLLAVCHFLTRAKVSEAALEGQPETERVRGAEMAAGLAMPVLTRSWQILLKGLGEAQTAPVPLQAVEMVLIRLAYSSQLPSPADLVRSLQGDGPSVGSGPRAASGQNGGGQNSVGQGRVQAVDHQTLGEAASVTGPQLAVAAPPDPAPEAPPSVPPPSPVGIELESLEAVVALARLRREAALANHLTKDIHLVHFERGRIEFRPGEQAPAQLAGQLSSFLKNETGQRWMVTLSQEAGAASLDQQAKSLEAQKREQAMAHPLVQAALTTFPGARLIDRRDKQAGVVPDNSTEQTGSVSQDTEPETTKDPT